MFHTPSRPVMYIPEYNAVLVPAGGRGPMKVAPEPPRRRRPLIDLVKFMQRKAISPALQYADGLPEEELLKTKNMDSEKAIEEMNSSMSEKEHEEILDNMRELVRTGVLDDVQVISQPKSITEIPTPQYRSTNEYSPYSYQFGGRLDNYQPRNQMFSQMNLNDRHQGYHYSYRYVIPKNPNTKAGGAQVSVQHKSIIPKRSNNYRYVEDSMLENQSILPVHYRSPRPEIQQRIEFNRLIPKIKNNNTNITIENSNKTKLNHTENVKHKETIQQKENLTNELLVEKKQNNEEKKILLAFDNTSGDLSEIKINTKTKQNSINRVDGRNNNTEVNTNIATEHKNISLNGENSNGTNNKATKSPIIDVDTLKLVIASSLKPTNLQLDSKITNTTTLKNDSTKRGKPDVTPRLLLKEHPSREGIREEMILMTGKKPTELILNPIARAIAGPRGVAVAAPIARAVIHPNEDVVVQFDPEAVAIAGPGGSAHSHPRLIITYLNHTHRN